MFNQILTIAIKELKLLIRDGGSLAVLFILPIVFVCIMTFAGVGNQGTRDAKILVVNGDKGPVAAWIVERLKKERGLEVLDKVGGASVDQPTAEAALLSGGSDYALVLVFPPEFSERVQTKDGSATQGNLVKFIADPATGGMNLNPIERLVKVQVMTVAGALAQVDASREVLQTLLRDKTDRADALVAAYTDSARSGAGNIQPNVQFQRVAPKGIAMSRPIKAEEQNVPGYTIFGIFFIVQVIGNTILREKENGTFTRLMAAPISRAVILLGKLTPFYLVNIIQVAFMFLFGYLVFDIRLGHSYGGLLMVTLATAAVANSLGLLISAVSRSTEQMGPLSGLVLVTMATMGGIFVPYFEMPKIMQKVAFFTPHAWSLQGFQDVLVRGYDATAVLPATGVLFGFALVFYLLALWRFRFH